MPDENTEPNSVTETEPEPAKNWQDEAEKWKRLSRENEKQAKANADAARKLAEFEESNRSETDKAIERAKREAIESTRKETLGVANKRILTAEVRAAAGGKLADPYDAVRLLDLDAFAVNDDGDVDAKSITKAIDELLAAKPYLAANAKRFEGSADGGARKTADDGSNVSPGHARLIAAYSQK